MTTQDIPLDERTAGQWWFASEETAVASVNETRRIGQALLEAVGATRDEAEFLFEIFLDKAIQGDQTRGLIDFPDNIRRIANGFDLSPECEILEDGGASCLIDSRTKPNNWFHNILMARFGMNQAIQRARQYGIGLASMRVSLVIPTAHILQALDEDMIGIAMTQCFPMVAPYGGYTPELGNAPIAFGIPAGKRDPVIVDMSLTNTSSSGVKQMMLRNIPVPDGFILDEFGNPTTNGADYPAKGHEWHGLQRSRGTLTTLGNGHKGFSLVFIVGLLTSVLNRTSFPWEATEVSMGCANGPGERYGSFFIAIDPARLGIGADEFGERVDGFIDYLASRPTREGVSEILYPGQKSQRLKRFRKEKDTYSLPKAHYDAFLQIAQEYGIPT